MNQDLLDRVFQSSRLPSLPTIALEVIALAQQQDVDVKQIAQTIQHDPALSGKILKTVNSSLYGLTHSISTISHALVVLGLNSVKTLALGFSLVGNLKNTGSQGFDHVSYWRRSLYSAASARALSQRAGIIQQEEAFLGGLLQDIGMVTLSQVLGEEYDALLRQAGAHHTALRRYEVEELGLDHAEVGGALAERWQLPPLLVAPIRYHEDATGVDGELLPLVRTVVLGNRVADIFLSTEGDGDALDTYYTQAEAWFDLERDQAEPLLKEIHEQTQEMGRLFDLPTGNLGNPDEILARANEALMQITLQSQQQARQLEQQNKQLLDEANTDALTGSSNRRAFAQFVAEQFEAATTSQPLSVLFMDVDHFKMFNDTHGHPVGDRVLIVVAETLQKAASGRGTVFRYGGEEFAIVCPGMNPEAAAQVAGQARRAIEERARVHNDEGQELGITCSIGVATHTGNTFANVALLVKAADQGLYAAKSSGRNCVQVYSPPVTVPTHKDEPPT